MARLLPLQAHRRHTPDQTPDTRNNDALRAAMQTAPGLGARRLNYHMSPHARLPIITLCSALLAAGGPKAAINLLRSLVSCVCAVQPRYTPSPYYCTVHVCSTKSPLPGYCIFHVRFHACAPCRPPAIHVLSVPMSRSAVTLSRRVSASASASPSPSPSPSSQSRCCQYAPAARALPSASAITPAVARPHTLTVHVDSRPAATATQHPVRGRVKAKQQRGEAV